MDIFSLREAIDTFFRDFDPADLTRPHFERLTKQAIYNFVDAFPTVFYGENTIDVLANRVCNDPPLKQRLLDINEKMIQLKYSSAKVESLVAKMKEIDETYK